MLVVVVHVFAQAASPSEGPAEGRDTTRAKLATGEAKSTTVVVIVDSMGESNATDPELMPNMVRLAPSGLRGPLESCRANFTLPCLLTSFEGRPSPFSKALSNFSGSATTHPNWLDAVRDAGLRIALITDHTLPELYPGTFVSGGSYQSLDIPVPDRDEYAIRTVLEWLDARQHEIVIAHLVGTDKVSHTHTRKEAEYLRVFAQADTFVGEVARRLRPGDSLVVFGDHGHGDGGHHTRAAWYMALGPRFQKAVVPLDQTTLVFLLSRLHHLALPMAYEGVLPWGTFNDSDEDERPWLALQAAAFGLAEGAASRADLEAEMTRRSEERSGKPLRDAFSFLPIWLHLVLILSALAGHFSERHPLRRGWLSWQTAWLVLAYYLPTAGPWLALPLQAWLSWPRRRGWSGAPALVLWSALAAASGVAIPWVFDTFHVKSGGSWVIIAWYVATVGVPLAAGVLIRRPEGYEGPRWTFALLLVVAVAALLPAPGVYYYGVAQSICHLLLPAAALAALALARPVTAEKVLLYVLFLGGLAFTPIRAGGWDWRFRLHLVLEQWPAPLQLTVAAVLVVLVASICRDRHPAARSLAVGLFLGIGAALPTFFQYEPARVLGFAIGVVSLIGGLRLLDLHRTPARTAWSVVVFAGLAYIVSWSILDGHYIKNVRMEFALLRLEPIFQGEAALALAVTGLIFARYFLVILPSILAGALAVSGERLMRLAPWVLLVLSFKLTAQALQIVAVQFVQEEQSSDLVIQEALGSTGLLLLLWLAFLLVALYRHSVQWTLGRSRIP